MEFLEKLDDIRVALAEYYLYLFGNMDGKSKTAKTILKQLVVTRNSVGGSITVGDDYFELGSLKDTEVVSFVLEGALGELEWLVSAEKACDVEARFSWVCEQESAALAADRSVVTDKKLCLMKGRFIVLWSVMSRLGLLD